MDGAFVSISLVVSSIMIGVITYISVLERRKEIGILRAIGASKRNVSEVFNAETFIIGLCSGVMGIVLSEILLIPETSSSRKSPALRPRCLPAVDAALFLVALATLLTILAGIIPPAAQQVQPRQSPARRVNPRDLIPGILSAPAAGIPGFFGLFLLRPVGSACIHPA